MQYSFEVFLSNLFFCLGFFALPLFIILFLYNKFLLKNKVKISSLFFISVFASLFPAIFDYFFLPFLHGISQELTVEIFGFIFALLSFFFILENIIKTFIKKLSKQESIIMGSIVILFILAVMFLFDMVPCKKICSGCDTAVKAGVSQIRNEIEICYDDKESYWGCDDLSKFKISFPIHPLRCGDNKSLKIIVSDDGQSYAIWADLCFDEKEIWCVDSFHNAKVINKERSFFSTERPKCEEK